MTKLIATKSMTYATRRLVAEDPFEAKSERDARLLVGIGKARYATEQETTKIEKAEARQQAKEDRQQEAAAKSAAAEALLDRLDNLNFFQFRAAAAEILGEETPTTKAEIVAALEKLAGVTN